MAALVATIVDSGRRNIYSLDGQAALQRVTKQVRVTTGAGSTTEWIAAADLEMSNVTGVIGAVVIAAAAVAPTFVFRKNAQGTSVAEGTNLGDLAVSSTAAVTLEVTVEGIPR